MKKTTLTIILSVFLIGIILAASIHNYYKIDLNYNRGEINLLSTNIEQSRELINNSYGLYSANVLDYENNVMDIISFDISTTGLYDTVDENGTIIGGGELELKELNFTLFIPYYENATKIIIYDENASKKLEIDVSFYSKTYEEYKEFNATNQNISNEEGATNQENVPVNENTTKEETFLQKISHYWWVLLIILAILLGILINSIRK